MAGFLSQSDKIPPDRIKRSVTTKMMFRYERSCGHLPDRVRRADRREFAAKFVKKRKYPYVIAVDAGLAVCEDLGLVPGSRGGGF